MPRSRRRSSRRPRASRAKKKSSAPPPPAPEPERKPAKTATGAAKAATTFTPEVLADAEKRLASYVGPLARLLIKDAASKSGNLKELYTQLAQHIDEDDERRAFLASLR